MNALGAIYELQLDIINESIDVVSILRKAHLIASKLNLTDFDRWIKNELNGYDNYNDIPDYKIVYGEIKAKDPYGRNIPVTLSSSWEKIKQRKLFNCISEIIDLWNGKNGDVMIGFPSEICEEICADYGYDLPWYLAIGKQSLKSIIEKVKNTVLDWCIQLEKDGINGEEFTFNEH